MLTLSCNSIGKTFWIIEAIELAAAVDKLTFDVDVFQLRPDNPDVNERVVEIALSGNVVVFVLDVQEIFDVEEFD